MTDRLTALSGLLQEKIRAALSDPASRPITPEAAKNYAAALKTLREVEESGCDTSQQLLIKFEGGDETWTG